MLQNQEWESFTGRLWKEECNVRDFIQNNYTPYDGDESFLAGPTDATNKLWDKLQALQKAERDNGGVLKEDADVVSSITAYGPGYIDPETKDLEQIVGLQTDEPLKRWLRKHSRCTDTSQTRTSTRSLQIITRHTIRQYLMLIHQR